MPHERLAYHEHLAGGLMNAQVVMQLRALWGRLGRSQQMAIIGVAGGALVFAFIFLNMGRSQTFITAFTNLDPKDSNAAVEALKAEGIPYQLSADGSTIKVPPEKLATARLKLSAKGLPKGGAVGFELFDKTSFGVTDFVQHINYQRALEGELSRTINTLEQVESARVHIVVPKQELFVSQQKPATASVLLRLRPGRTLDEGALRGIAHLVSRSVQGLEQQNITIVDDTGRMLFDGGSLAENSVGLSASQMDIQKKLEKSIEAEVQSMLDRVAGPNRGLVRVKAEMDFSRKEETAETYTPGGPNNQGVPRSTSNITETYTGGQNGGQQPGAQANVPGRAGQVAANGSTNSYQRSETTTNYEVSKSTSHTITGPGQIKRLSVSVLLDSSIPEQDATGLRDAVAAAAGINQQRGDQLVVTTAAFGGTQNQEPLAVAKKAGLPSMLFQYAKVGVPLLAAVIVLFFVWRMSKSVAPVRIKVETVHEQPPALTPAPAAAAAYALAAAGGGEGGAMPAGERFDLLPEPGRRGETPEQAARRLEIQQRMSNLATANPEAIAEIIHSWMAQDDKKK